MKKYLLLLQKIINIRAKYAINNRFLLHYNSRDNECTNHVSSENIYAQIFKHKYKAQYFSTFIGCRKRQNQQYIKSNCYFSGISESRIIHWTSFQKDLCNINCRQWRRCNASTCGELKNLLLLLLVTLMIRQKTSQVLVQESLN